MRSVAPRFGVTFSDYIRVGYGRFALTDAAYREPGVQATAERIEISSPVAWLWSRVADQGADVRIGKWAVTMSPTDAPEKPKDRKAPSGWVPMRQQVRDALVEIEPWISRATIGPGQIKTSASEVSVGGVTWQDRTLRLN